MSTEAWIAIIAAVGAQLVILVGAVGGLIVTLKGNKDSATRAAVRDAQVAEIHSAVGAPSAGSDAVKGALKPTAAPEVKP